MISITSKPIKKTEVFLGTIVMAVPHTNNTTWEFELRRTTNGTNKDEVIPIGVVETLSREYDMDDYTHGFVADIESVIVRTVLANLSKELINWR
jgi:hypothetical protein